LQASEKGSRGGAFPCPWTPHGYAGARSPASDDNYIEDAHHGQAFIHQNRRSRSTLPDSDCTIIRTRAERGITLSTSSIFWGLLFGSIGLGYFLYGRKQQAIVPLLSGLALMVFPYFVSNAILLVAIGLALAVLPWFFRV